MKAVVVTGVFQPARTDRQPGAPSEHPGTVIPAGHRFRRVRRFCRRSYALVSFLVLCPILLFGPDSSLRIVDSFAGYRGVVARERQP
jgi:hypothetical protein